MAEQAREKQAGNDTSQPLFSTEEEEQVVRKIDSFVLPMLCLVFFFQYLDKQGLSYASVFGLIEDLSLHGSEYSWCSSIFYVGQLISEYPFIYLMSRLPLTRFVGITIIIWGGVCMCLAACQTFTSFAAVRFLLGVSEGAVAPAFVTLTSVWYRKREHAVRVGVWITMDGLAQTIGCLLMYAIGRTSPGALAPWRTFFLICGALSCLCGVIFILVVPSSPQKAWFLTPREIEVLEARMALDRDAGDLTHFSLAQVKETVRDLRSWFMFIFGVLVTMQAPVLTFASLIIKNLNYSSLQTMLYTAPSGAVQMLAIWISLAGCYLLPQNRCLVVMVMTIPPLVGNILLLKLPLSAGWALIVASWLASCLPNILALVLSLSASNVKGNTKRPMVNALFFIGYCTGCIAAPQLWKSDAAPRFFEGIVTDIVTWCLLIVALGVYWYLCRSENRRRDEMRAHSSQITFHPGDDLTDIQDVQFRYNH
ncbi:MFS general substrate transporter [Aspergillus saccharolyticus JOP 1030-1]|uniref:MFS general substrate transporter n=1 Tax=Aspergillus saccharolyticus JOP 1030-1 TaxID=1450539 RepID=A0A318ZUK1_9EURO|nr:MFS general substrate transporter [Aspergillus saccharolyticus JOP 1030-1]PYH43758.1 MFS general substrate transporter [Aspergillus saccharolyticus JOP 1030-1]